MCFGVLIRKWILTFKYIGINMTKIKALILILVIISLFSCSDKKPKIKVFKPTYYIKYFKEKNITSKNNYKYVNIRFDKEIHGSPYEIDQKLKTLNKEKDSYYKVYYSNLSQMIDRYEFYQQNSLKAYAIYSYGNVDSIMSDILHKISYYDDKRSLIAYDLINYDKFLKPLSVMRFRMPGRYLSHIF